MVLIRRRGVDYSNGIKLSYTIVGEPATKTVAWFVEGIHTKMQEKGHVFHDEPGDETGLIFNLVDENTPRPFRRKSQSVFVVSILEGVPPNGHVLQTAYPHLLRNISNLLIYHTRVGEELRTYFITPEQGYPHVNFTNGDVSRYFENAYERIAPVACSRFVINNEFTPDLPEELAHGTEKTRQLFAAGKKLDEMDLLPTVIKIEQFLTPEALRQLWRLYRVGGLSYGNLSVRHDETTFWMSASGVDKSDLRNVGEHIHLVKGYDPDNKAILVSIPKHIKRPVRVSVDAIEHWMVYTQNPGVGAIIHAHCWIDDAATQATGHTVAFTKTSYPCGTVELGEDTAEVIRNAPDPSRVVVCQKNHGLVITGRDLTDIFERIESGAVRIIKQIEMT
jgi:ribulose-5-phosphate 4-epimerase/fuculose-1-phosphate aldolase